MTTQTEETSWHLDKKVPIALIFVLLGQLGMGVWVASKLQAQVENHDRRIVSLEMADQRMSSEATRISEFLARLDERLQAQTVILRRMEETLRQHPQPSR